VVLLLVVSGMTTGGSVRHGTKITGKRILTVQRVKVGMT
jgi:hypothetical protein